MPKIPSILLVAAKRAPDRVAIATRESTVSYAQLAGLALDFAQGVELFVPEKNGRVAFILSDGIRFLVAHFGVLLASRISVPLDEAYETRVIEKILWDCGARFLVLDQALYEKYVCANVKFPPYLKVACFLLTDCGVKWEIKSEAVPWLEAEELNSSRELAADVIMYTSGTTGSPKGVLITAHNVFSMVKSVVEFVGYTSESKEVVPLAISHSFGLGQIYCVMYACGSVYWDPHLVFPGYLGQVLRRFSATSFSGTPATLAALIKHHPSLINDCSSHLKFCVINSAPLPPEQSTAAMAQGEGFKVFHYYGLTEASRSTFVLYNVVTQGRLNSVGKSMRHARVKIIDESGLEVPIGTVGQILISGGAVASGYWNDPQVTASAFKGGWLQTGDRGYLDCDRYLYIVGRSDDIINLNGQKFHPAEVEAVIGSVSSVLDVGVGIIAAAQDGARPKIVALIKVSAEGTLDLKYVRAVCREKLMSFKVPKVFLFTNDVPRRRTGKIDRTELQRLIQRSIGGMG